MYRCGIKVLFKCKGFRLNSLLRPLSRWVLYGSVIKYLSIPNPVETQNKKVHIAASKEVLKQFLPAHLWEAKTQSCL